MEIDFIGGAYTGRSTDVNAQKCINLYPVLDAQGGKPLSLVGTPGLKVWCTLGNAPSDVRGMIVANVGNSEKLYVVADNDFYEVTTAGSDTDKGNLTGASGPAYMDVGGVASDQDGARVVVVDSADNKGYFYDDNTGALTGITAATDALAPADGTDDDANWTKTDCTFVFTNDPGNGQGEADVDDNYYVITETGATQRISRALSLTVGGVYTCGIYILDGTGTWAGSTLNIMNNALDTTITTLAIEKGRSVWYEHTVSWTATETNNQIVIDLVLGSSETAKLDTPTVKSEFFPAATSLTEQDGYFVVSVSGDFKFQVSDPDDPTKWGITAYADVDGHEDDLQRVISVNREMWMIGKETTEPWYNNAVAEIIFERLEASYIEIGCDAGASVSKFDNSLAWLSNKLNVIRMSGYTPKVISTSQIDYQIDSYSTTSDAIGFSYIQDGHEFYVLIFPTEKKTWVYDATTGYWHERRSYAASGDRNDTTLSATEPAAETVMAVTSSSGMTAGDYISIDMDSGGLHNTTIASIASNNVTITDGLDGQAGSGNTVYTYTSDGRWRANCYAYFNGKHLVGDFENGIIYEMDLDTYTDNLVSGDDFGFPKNWERTAQAIRSDRNRFFVSSLEIEFESGVGLSGSGVGSDPQAKHDWSDDGGHTFVPLTPLTADMGTDGSYEQLTKYNRLGHSRGRICRVRGSAPVKTVILGAHIKAEGGTS